MQANSAEPRLHVEKPIPESVDSVSNPGGSARRDTKNGEERVVPVTGTALSEARCRRQDRLRLRRRPGKGEGAEILGHKTLAMVQRYSHLSNRHIVKLGG